MPLPPSFTLFPYTTLFRSVDFAAERNLLLRFIELMPVSTSEVLSEENFFPIRAAQRELESRYGALIPEPGLTRRSAIRSEEHTSELQSRQYLVCRLLLEKK